MELMRKVQLVACAATAIQRIEFKKDVEKIDRSGSIYIYIGTGCVAVWIEDASTLDSAAEQSRDLVHQDKI
jgi:hypothetical protein